MKLSTILAALSFSFAAMALPTEEVKHIEGPNGEFKEPPKVD